MKQDGQNVDWCVHGCVKNADWYTQRSLQCSNF